MALRASKSRNIKNLKKIAKNLQQKQIYEPVECLFIVYSKGKKIYKYFGTGHMVNRFEKGQPLAIGTDLKISRSSKDYSFYKKNKIKSDSFLTPNKYKFNFTEGAGKDLARRQKEELENLVLSDKNAKLKQLYTARGTSRSERGNTRRGRGRGAPTNVRGRGRGGKTRQRETTSESEEDENMSFESGSERENTRRGRGRGAPTNVRGRGRGGKTRQRETPHGHDHKEDEEQHPSNDSGPHGHDHEEDEEQHPSNDSGPECQKKLFEDEDTVIDDSFHGSYQGYNSEDQLSPLYPLDSSLLRMV